MRAPSLPPLAAAAVLLAACGAPSSKDVAAGNAGGKPVPCRATLDDAVKVAVTSYVKQAKPRPERFLVSTGTDSALGDAGLTALQDKGPTYLFPGDPALQTQVRSLLHDKGDYTTLLVVRHGAEAKDGTASVRLNGHYVGGAEDGQAAGPRTVTMTCDSTDWKLPPGSEPAPAPTTPAPTTPAAPATPAASAPSAAATPETRS